MRTGKFLIFMVLTCLFFVYAGNAVGQQKDSVVVLVQEFEPTVMKNQEGLFTGFEIELWEEVAKSLKLDYRYQEIIDFDEQLRLVVENKGDVAISGITITSKRENGIDFSHRTLDSGLQIVVRNEVETDIISSFLPLVVASWKVLIYLTVFSFFMAILFIFFDKKENGQRHTILEGVYWAIVTMSTVGYGDYSAKTRAGKIISIITILFGLAIFGNYIGTVSSLNVTQKLKTDISGPSDLAGKKVATVENTTSVDALRIHGSLVTTTKDLVGAYELLVDKKEVDAVVFDAPPLAYHISQTGDGKSILAGSIFDRQDYGFAFPEGSPLREKVNRVLLELQESGVYQKLHLKYFGK